MSCLRAPGQLPSHDITGWTVTSKFMRTMVLASLDPNMNMIQFCLFRFVYTRGWNVSLLSDYWLRKASWLVFDKWAAAFPLGTLHKSINCSEAYTACPFNTIHVGYLLAQLQCHSALVLGAVMLCTCRWWCFSAWCSDAVCRLSLLPNLGLGTSTWPAVQCSWPNGRTGRTGFYNPSPLLPNPLPPQHHQAFNCNQRHIVFHMEGWVVQRWDWSRPSIV